MVPRKIKLTAAFNDLNEHGILAYEDFMCCRSCGFASLQQEIDVRSAEGDWFAGIAFYHGQDTAAMNDGGRFAIAYRGVSASDEEVAQAIVEALNRHGIQASWCGDTGRRVEVSLRKVTAAELRHSWCSK